MNAWAIRGLVAVPVGLVGTVDQQQLRKAVIQLTHVLRTDGDDGRLSLRVFIHRRHIPFCVQVEVDKQFSHLILVRKFVTYTNERTD
jgi:hypothetical protein